MNVAIAIGVLSIVAVVWMLHSLAPAETSICIDADAREKVRAILLAGIEKGLKDHTVQVYNNWLSDPREQPERAIRGMRNGISAYVRSRTAAMKWSPPPCKGGEP
jgi:hypothetical protein